MSEETESVFEEVLALTRIAMSEQHFRQLNKSKDIQFYIAIWFR